MKTHPVGAFRHRHYNNESSGCAGGRRKRNNSEFYAVPHPFTFSTPIAAGTRNDELFDRDVRFKTTPGDEEIKEKEEKGGKGNSR